MKHGNKKRNTAIQLLRIIACILVFLVHYGQRLELKGEIRQFTNFGEYGVHLFFIISGLLAAKELQNKEKTITYYKKRIISIMPVYYLVIIWYFITETILHYHYHQIPIDTNKLVWLRYIFLLNGFLPNNTYFWSNLGMTRTIPIFAFFYLIVPFIIKIIKNYKVALLLMILSFFISKDLFTIYPCTIFENIHYFFIGIFIYYCWKENKLKLSSILFLIQTIYCLIYDLVSYYYIFAVVTSVMLEKEIKINEKIKNTINLIDEHTYTFYLIQGVVFCSLIDKLNEFNIVLSSFSKGFITIFLTISLTILVHNYIEKPIQNILKKI